MSTATAIWLDEAHDRWERIIDAPPGPWENDPSPTTRAVSSATTLEWHCTRCDSRAWTTLGGGVTGCECKPHDASTMEVFRIFLGEREFWGTLADIGPQSPVLGCECSGCEALREDAE